MKNFYPNTPLSSFIPMPHFMLTSKHSVNAKFLYALLLHRTMLSQKNGWADEEGNVYVIYPIRQLAEDLGRSPRTVSRALLELEKEGLLQRVPQGRNSANRIFLMQPEDTTELSPPLCQNDALDTTEMSCCGETNWHTNKNNIEINNFNKKERNKEERKEEPFFMLGEYKNVRLSSSGVTRLRILHPLTYEDGIQRLSHYLRKTGRQIQNHYAVLRRWLDEDRRREIAGEYGGDDALPFP